MAFDEKRAWIMLMVASVSYLVYVVIILGRAENIPLAEVSYGSTLLWTIGIAIAATIVLQIVVVAITPRDTERDQRDREIHRFGEYIGQSFVVLGGLVALGMSIAELKHFWIANVIYLAFTLSGVVGCTAKIFFYRRGFQHE